MECYSMLFLKQFETFEKQETEKDRELSRQIARWKKAEEDMLLKKREYEVRKLHLETLVESKDKKLAELEEERDRLEQDIAKLHDIISDEMPKRPTFIPLSTTN